MDRRPAEQDKDFDVASLEPVLKPRSIAIIGASRRKRSIGNTLFHNLLHHEFGGVVYPVNPKAEVVGAVQAYRSVLDIPGEVDLAIIITPADTVRGLMEECGRKGVRGVIVISAGFGESSPEGKAKEDELVETARRHGMRLVGPNCMGIINTDPEISMNATFSSIFPPAGVIAMSTQSGALGLAILEYARNLNIGLSTFASIGNRADVSSNDLLEYWAKDPATKVILLYLESFGNPKKFVRIAREVTLSKPVVAVKSGRTAAGSRAAASHTGALATAEIASEALFAQTGMIRVDTVEQLFDVANLLSRQPLPRGKRVAVLTNGGGPGIMTADACADRGLELPALAKETAAELRSFLSPRASVVNPVDMTADGTPETYRRALEVLARDDGIDIVIVIFVPPIPVASEAVADAVAEMAPEFRRRGKTVVASFMGSRGAGIECNGGDDGCVPSFAFPERAAAALAGACEYSEWLQKPKGMVPELAGINRDKAREIVSSALKQSQGRPLWLEASAVSDLLESYGIRVAALRTAGTAEEAAAAAEEIGFPVAVKLLSEEIVHKTEVGGVILSRRSSAEVSEAFEQIRQRLKDLGKAGQMQGVAVQQMVPEGIEVIVGLTQDPSFGPLIMFGLGGIYAEFLKDVAFRIHPLTDVDARDMVRSVKAHQLFTGWRGAKPTDIAALEDLLLRVSAMVEDLPEIEEMDLNPVKAQEEGKGYVVVDSRILLS
ncbi:MAG: acetate--CoA ligase family protein [Dehalococcoidia bacterium]|nr:acetate--CoA ligase family protein [Dehalococcoidia bacterium]